MTIELLTPIIQQENVRNIHFFNGRLLTAEDMLAEQRAHRRQRQQLGQAIGTGVVSGLQVSIAEPIDNVPQVTINSGLAINPAGQVIQLPESVDVALVRKTSCSSGTGIFEDCDHAAVTETIHGQTSIYVLTISPASSYEGHVPMHQLSDNGIMTGCGKKYAIEGVKFNLIGMYINNLAFLSSETRSNLVQLLINDDDQIPRLSLLRNLLAHICLGTEEAASFGVNPFARPGEGTPFSPLGTRKAVQLSGCEVPLALVHLTTKGIRFLDMWAVRRRPTPTPPAWLWPLSAGSRRLADKEAAYSQFQEHLDWLLFNKYPTEECMKIDAKMHFRYLPSAGLLRESNEGNNGVNLAAFFDEIPYNDDHFIGGDRLNYVLNSSFYHHPIDLQLGEGMVVYRTRENQMALKNKIPDVIPYVLFASPHMPLIDTARYYEGRWDYGNIG